MKLELGTPIRKDSVYVSLEKEERDVLVKINGITLLRIKGQHGEVWMHRNDAWKGFGFSTQANGAVVVEYY